MEATNGRTASANEAIEKAAMKEICNSLKRRVRKLQEKNPINHEELLIVNRNLLISGKTRIATGAFFPLCGKDCDDKSAKPLVILMGTTQHQNCQCVFLPKKFDVEERDHEGGNYFTKFQIINGMIF